MLAAGMYIRDKVTDMLQREGLSGADTSQHDNNSFDPGNSEQSFDNTDDDLRLGNDDSIRNNKDKLEENDAILDYLGESEKCYPKFQLNKTPTCIIVSLTNVVMDDTKPQTSYEVWYKEKSKSLQRIEGSDDEFVLDGLTAGTEYGIVIVEYVNGSEKQISSISLNTDFCGPPTDLVIDEIEDSDDTFRLSWQEPNMTEYQDPLIGYEVDIFNHELDKSINTLKCEPTKCYVEVKLDPKYCYRLTVRGLSVDNKLGTQESINKI